MKRPLVSIIIPIYNAETHLARCVESILGQTFGDFELLLVNDGSGDGSLAVCQRYAAMDSRVRVLDKANGGVSSARNLGIESAAAEWVMFVDADDWVESNMLELAVPYADSYDIVRLAWVAHHANNVAIQKRVMNAESPQQLLKQLIRRRTKLAIWGTLIHRELFMLNDIRFDVSYDYAEDWLALLRVVCRAKSVKTLPEAYVYHYDMANMSSCINNMSVAKMACNVRLCHDVRAEMPRAFRADLRDTRLELYRLLVATYGKEEVCRHIGSIRHSVDFFTLWEVLVANFGWRKKRELFAFWRYAKNEGLK